MNLPACCHWRSGISSSKIMTHNHTHRAFRIGVAGPVGSGKTALVHVLSQKLWPEVNLAVVTNDIYTREDAEFLIRQGTLAGRASDRR